MTFMPPAAENSEQESEQEADLVSIDDFHVLRSKFVEKCASAERHVLRLLRVVNGTWSAKAPLSQKIEQLRKMLSQPDCKVRVVKIGKLLDRLEPQSNLRSELVHSTISISNLEGIQAVVLWPSDEPQPADGRRTILTFDKLKHNWRDLSQVVNALEQEATEAEKKASHPFRKDEI